MDAVVVIGIALYFILSNKSVKREYVVELEIRDNPNFHREERAFVKLFDAIMKGDER